MLKRRALQFALIVPACVLLFLFAVWLCLQSAFVVNRAASLAAPLLGYRVSVQTVSFMPNLKAELSGLTMTPLDGKGASFLCARAEIKGTVKSVITAEVEKLVLTGPKLFFRLDAGKEKADLSSLDKLPSVGLLVIEEGEVEVVYGDTHLRLAHLAANVKNFSPDSGGSAFFEAAANVASQGQPGVTGRGNCKGQVDLIGPLRSPKGKGTIEISFESVSYSTNALKDLLVTSSFLIEKGKVALNPLSVSVGSARVKSEDRDVTVEAFTFASDASYEFASSRLAMKSFHGTGPGLGSYTGGFEGGLQKDMAWKVSLEAPFVNFTQVFSMVKPFLPDEYGKWTIQGMGSLETSGEGKLGGTGDWKADVRLSFRDGGFKSGDASKAGQKITGSVMLKLRSGPEKQKARFDLAAEAGDGEFLWGSYYKDFKGRRIRITSEGSYSLERKLAMDGSGSVDLLNTGEYKFSGQIGKENTFVHVTGKHLSHPILYSTFVRDYVAEVYPDAAKLEMSGASNVDLRATLKDGRAFFEGMFSMDEAGVSIPDVFSMSGVTLSLPFNLVYPSEASTAEPREGDEALLRIKELKKRNIAVDDLDIPFVLSQNNLRVLKDIDLKLYGGELRLSRFEAHDIFSSERILSLALVLDHLDLGLLTADLLGERVEGTVNADFPGVTFRRSRWTAKGQVETSVFGGSIELTGVFGENVFSASRRVGCDIAFRDISLEELTRKIKLGKMTGIIKGSIANLIIEYGEPARFFLDVESDPTKKVSQLISVDAVENLSIIGTGSSGISAVLNSGVNRFFKEYPYSWIGILCSLENDTFRIRGKKSEGGKDYLVKRGWLRGLDVIIQDPDNAISFKDMEERIGRIFHSKQKPKNVS